MAVARNTGDMGDHTQEPPRQEELDTRPPPRLRLSRRRFLTGLLGAVSAVAGIVGLRTLTSPSGKGSGGGSTAGGLESLPVRTVDDVPDAPLERWEIIVDGLVEQPVTVDHATWTSLPHVAHTADFHCVEG